MNDNESDGNLIKYMSCCLLFVLAVGVVFFVFIEPMVKDIQQPNTVKIDKITQLDINIYPKGFRNLLWGDSLKQLKNAHLVTDNTHNIKFKGNFLNPNNNNIVEQCYEKTNDDLTLGDANLSKIQYCFVDSKFEAFKLYFKEYLRDDNGSYKNDNNLTQNKKQLEDAIMISYYLELPSQNGKSLFDRIADEQGFQWQTPQQNENLVRIDYQNSMQNQTDNSFIEIANLNYYSLYSQAIQGEYVKTKKKTLKENLPN
jgi:hypothetical protein